MELIEGRQPVREALRAGRRMERILVARGAHPKGTLAEILELAATAGIPIERLPREQLEARATTATHQGVIAEAQPLPQRSWREGVAAARAAGRPPLLLALDEIQDPQNAGALLRSAEVFAADAVLMPIRRSAPAGASLTKASAGAIEHLIVDRVTNLERALSACREDGLWVVALAADGAQDVSACALLAEPVVIVVGSEGKGVSRLIRERADVVVRIPTVGRIDSLNASVAGAICLWEAVRVRSRETI